MKKIRILIPMLAAVLTGMFSTSCQRDVTFESVNTRVMEATIYRNQWNDDGSGYLWKTYDWDAITTDVLNYGNVDAYVYDGGRQCPLPHILPITYTFSDGSSTVVPENLRFDFEPGKITFIMQDLDGEMPEGLSEEPITFRVVATVPVQYVLEK